MQKYINFIPPPNIYAYIAAMHQINQNNIALIHQILAIICTSVGIIQYRYDYNRTFMILLSEIG